MSIEVEAVLAMMATIRSEFESKWPSTPEAARVRSVARAIATENGWGEHLDDIVMGHPSKTPAGGIAYCGKGTVSILFPLQPCWATYVRDAQAAIYAIDQAEKR